MDLKESKILTDAIDGHWYYSSKAEALATFIHGVECSKILDIGAGSGYFSKFLLKRTNAKEAWCYDINYEKSYDLKYADKKIYFSNTLNGIDANLILLMDVLEHVDEDLGFLKSFVISASKGTKFLISVPAFMFLWSRHDDFLEHKRRYQMRDLNLLVEIAGLKIIKSAYFFSIIFPIAFVVRIFLEKLIGKNSDPKTNLKKHSNIVNSLLKVLCSFDRRFIFRHNRFFGLSIFCLAEKQ